MPSTVASAHSYPCGVKRMIQRGKREGTRSRPVLGRGRGADRRGASGVCVCVCSSGEPRDHTSLKLDMYTFCNHPPLTNDLRAGVGGLATLISTISSGIWKSVTLIKSYLCAPAWLAAGISPASVDERSALKTTARRDERHSCDLFFRSHPRPLQLLLLLKMQDPFLQNFPL